MLTQVRVGPGGAPYAAGWTLSGDADRHGAAGAAITAAQKGVDFQSALLEKAAQGGSPLSFREAYGSYASAESESPDRQSAMGATVGQALLEPAVSDGDDPLPPLEVRLARLREMLHAHEKSCLKGAKLLARDAGTDWPPGLRDEQ